MMIIEMVAQKYNHIKALTEMLEDAVKEVVNNPQDTSLAEIESISQNMSKQFILLKALSRDYLNFKKVKS